MVQKLREEVAHNAICVLCILSIHITLRLYYFILTCNGAYHK